MPAPAIACTLTPDQLKDCKGSLLPGLVGRASHVSPIEDGYRFTFPAADRDIVGVIASCIEAERHCCQFLDFALTVPAGAGTIELVVTGPAGTREFLEAFLA